MNLNKCQIFDLPRINDPRGNLTFVEANRHIPFDIRRVYYLHDVPGGSERGGHAHKALHQLIIAMSGSFDIHLDDGHGDRRRLLRAQHRRRGHARASVRVEGLELLGGEGHGFFPGTEPPPLYAEPIAFAAPLRPPTTIPTVCAFAALLPARAAAARACSSS